ncbi:replication factor C subunit 1-like isoform X2 [Acanthaster planci]|uniref:Replication factor C subunit 1 n=1 Tax=Acanthaster planci TaxID=133434 RepID=A0A8B7YJZ6_ACAPL|nr:replication factor C subunit 1-like isoform X2 [Acanthaster planci]
MVDPVMPVDIRSFFGVTTAKSKSSQNGKSSSNRQPNSTGGKRKRQLEDEDDDFTDSRRSRKRTGSKPAKMKKSAIIYDSESDEEPRSSKGKGSTVSKSSNSPSKAASKKKVLTPSPKQKVTTVSDFFGSSPIQRSTKKVTAKKPELEIEITPKKPRLAVEHHDDPDFQKTLELLDEDHTTPTKNRRTDDLKSAEKPSPSRRSPRIYKMDVSPALKKGKGIASKIAEKVKSNSKTLVEETPERGQGERSHSRSKVTVEETPQRSNRRGAQTPDATSSKAAPAKHTPTKATPTKATTSKVTPTKATPSRSTPSKGISSAKSTPSKTTPTKAPSPKEKMGGDSAEKKKGGGANYRRYLSRDGPRSLGAKEMPQGEENCLAGLAFVITGVLDYVEKEEAKQTIEHLGGKVTTGVTKKTSYLVTGRDPGPVKIQKAEAQGTKILTEDELFDLIRTRPGKKPSVSKVSQPKAEPVSTKQSAQTKPKVSPKMDTTPSQSLSTSSSPAMDSKPTVETEKLGESLLWVDKYKPQNMKQLIGQQGERSCANKLLKWLKRWHDNNFGPNKDRARFSKDDGFCFKAALLSGPPGIGKTTTAELVCKELGFKTLELNASSSRSKKTLDLVMKEFLHTDSIEGYFKAGGGESKGQEVEVHRQCLLMDEVDGMSGNEDRGGIQEFIQMIKKSHIPVICMCNDRNHPKIRSLANHCFDLRFYRPQVKQIKGAMLSIAFKEGVSIPPQAMDHIITASNQDIRQVLHNMSMWSAGMKNLSQDQVDSDAKKAKKDLKLGPWDVLKQVFACDEEAEKMSLTDKMGLFFHDYSIAPLFVHENYLSIAPKRAKGDIKQHLGLLSRAADSICSGDLVDRAIRTTQRWSLLPTQAIFASVLPGDAMKGYMRGMIQFPSWLGKNSSRNKNRRLLQEIQQHMRLSSSGSMNDITFDYVPRLRDFLTQPLLTQESDGVSEVVELLNSYDLTREDFDTVLEVSQFEGKKNPMAGVPSKVKAAFTRAFNKEGHMVPYAYGDISKKRKVTIATEDVDAYGEGDMVVEEEGSDDDDISKNAMVKVQAAKTETSTKSSVAKSKGSKGKAPARGGGAVKGKSKAKK